VGHPLAGAGDLLAALVSRAGHLVTNPDISGRPLVVSGNTQLFFPGMRRMSENSVINIKNKSHAVSAEIDGRRLEPRA
jgi:hypothetical protein